VRPLKILTLLSVVIGVGLIARQTAPWAGPAGQQEQSTNGKTETGDTKGGPLMPNGLLRLRFERSGGLAPLPVSGAVSFLDDHAEVAADAVSDKRQLAHDELGVFKGLDLDALHVSNFSTASGQEAAGQPDRYQYDVTLETRSGRNVTLRFSEQPAQALNSATQGLGDLADWVRRESGEIWKKKAAQKP
jgi:hypothetical protein